MRTLPLAVSLFLPAAAQAATLTVGPSARMYTTIGAAVSAAVDGDRIEVDGGSYRESLAVTKDLVFVGLGGSQNTRIRGDGTVVEIDDADVEFHGFDIQNASTGQGFNLDNDANVLLEDVKVAGHDNYGNVVNAIDDGGGVYAHNSTIEVVDCWFDNNAAGETGAHIALVGSTATITGTTFIGGQAAAGGAISARGQSTLTIADSLFEGNVALGNGGAITGNSASRIAVSSTTFEDNRIEGTGGSTGGAVHLGDAGTAGTFVTSTFRGNSARTHGGAIYASGVTLSTDRVLFELNTAGNEGVAVHVGGSGAYSSIDDVFQFHTAASGRYGGAVYGAGSVVVTFDGGTFEQNSANRGGAVAYAGTSSLTVLDSTFDANIGVSRGGAIDFNPPGLSLGAIFSVSGSDFVGNRVTATNNTAVGGAIFATVANVSIAGSTFTDNRASFGGGVYAQAVTSFNVTNSEFCANDALAGAGGGLNVAGSGGRADVRNVVFAENTASTSGGGLFVSSALNVGVTNNTFAGNRATTQGGATYYNNATIAFRNNIVRGTPQGNGLSSNSTSTGAPSIGFNDWHQNTTKHTGDALANVALDGTNLVDVAPGLGAWSQDGDCSNDDFKPNPGDPVINKGDPALLDPDGSRSDIGAYGGPSASKSYYVDSDNDNFIALFDCDDSVNTVFPGAAERCNGVDDDCDAAIDEAGAVDAKTVYADADRDGYGDSSTSTIACAASGWVSDKTDCDDAAGAVNPGANELCNLRDDDCDNKVDDTPAQGEQTWFPDVDGDGFGDASAGLVACFQPAGTVLSGTDCDDGVAAVFPGASEVCNLRDDDCDGRVDVGVSSGVTVYLDADGDGFGDGAALLACDLQPGYAAVAGDCDDSNAGVSPQGIERCNGLDDDCDAVIDDAAVDARSWFTDVDKDGFGDDKTAVSACDQPPGRVGLGGDCKDTDAAYRPGADEVCSGTTDLNCDGSVGDVDGDADGFAACDDCDDSDAAINADGEEVCDRADNDCNGLFDEPAATDARTWYADQDADGFGKDQSALVACDPPGGHAAAGGDCDDTDATYHPGAFESCVTGVDNNCDGAMGKGDGDGDGVAACEECDDADPNTYPDAAELCDDVDNDCDGAIDEDGSVMGPEWFADVDGDGFGNGGAAVRDCEQPVGHTDDATDCDDADELSNPDAVEIWYDGVDQTCDGGSDADQDGDGRDAESMGGQDCDDLDATVFPGADDAAGDGLDQDCSGADGPVLDGDDVPIQPGSCKCDAGAGAGGLTPWLGLLGVFGLRRRR